MKINEVLTEAGVMDTLKAIAKDPRLLANPKNISATANRLRTQRDVQQLAGQMVKVWNNVVNQERKRLQGAGSDGTIGEDSYQQLLAKFIEKNIVGTKLDSINNTTTKQQISKTIQLVQDNRGTPRQFNDLFSELISLGLVARVQASSQTQQEPSVQQTPTDSPPPRSVNAVIDALKDAGVRTAELRQLKAAISAISGIQPIRTQDTTTRALLQALGIPVA